MGGNSNPRLAPPKFGTPGISVGSLIGPTGPQGVPGGTILQDTAIPDEPLIIPGPQGLVGPAGLPVPSFIPPDDPEMPMMIPGTPGPAGIVGTQGPPGPWFPAIEDQLEPMMIPGTPGANGLNGSGTPGAWSTYTPVWAGTGGTTDPTVGNGSISGRYLVLGNLLYLSINLLMGSTSTGGNRTSNTFSLPSPFVAKTGGLTQELVARGFTSGVQHFRGVADVAPGSTVINSILLTDSTGNTWGNSTNGPATSANSYVRIQGILEID